MRYRFVLFPVGITSKIFTSWIVDFIAVPSKNCVVISVPVYITVLFKLWGLSISSGLKANWRIYLWEASMPAKLNNFIRHKAKVLSDDVPNHWALSSSWPKSLVARTFDPFNLVLQFQNLVISRHSKPRSGRSERCHRSWSLRKLFNPPLVAIFVHCFPVID